jgi:cell division protein FtsA
MILPRRSLRKPLTEGTYASILDLGTTCLKTAVCELRPGQAVVLGVGREPLGDRAALTSQGDYAISPELLASLCDVALRRAEDMTVTIANQKIVPDHVVIGAPGDVMCSFSTTIQVKRAKPESRVGEDELTALLQRAQRLAARQLLDHPKAREQYGRGGWALTNAMVSELLVDGVRVVDPLRFQGKSLQLTTVSVFVPNAFQQLLDSLATDLDLQLMRLVAEPFALATCFPAGDAIFLDVGGDRTDVALVRQGTVAAIASLPLGSRSLTHQIGQRLGMPFDRAEETKLRRSPAAQATTESLPTNAAPSDQPSPTRQPPGSRMRTRPATQHPLPTPSDPVADTIRDFVSAWLDGLAAILIDVANHEPLPLRILLSGGGCQLPELAPALSSPTWVRRLPFDGLPDVGVLPAREVRGVVDRTQRLIGPQDVPLLGLARLAAWADHPETLQDRLLKKVISGHAVPFGRTMR